MWLPIILTIVVIICFVLVSDWLNSSPMMNPKQKWLCIGLVLVGSIAIVLH